MRILDEEGIPAQLLVLQERYDAFMDRVKKDDLHSERHPLCDQCIGEFLDRVATSFD